MTRAHDPTVPSGATFQLRYRILETLGVGGFGAVYKAVQLITGQFVAIKILRLDAVVDAERHLARFQREMLLSGQLHHPNIVRLLDSGEADDGVMYSVFEFVPGQTLGQILSAEGSLDPHEARHLMVQVLDALSCAHARGVIHRDLKPENVMVVPTGARRNALVLDFGIGAIVEGSRDPGYQQLTATHEALGTPAYAAPEQLSGRPPTARADLYAWGLVFLECLTGKPAISGGSVLDVVMKQMGPEPIAMPPALEQHPLGVILRRALVKDVDARDVTAVALVAELEACDLRGLRKGTFTEEPRGAPFTLGAPRAASAAAHTLDAMEPPPPASFRGNMVEGERRQLTALCCELRAVPMDASELDIEEIDDLFREAQQICSAVTHRAGGHAGGALGERLLFLFGYPLAQEDDARRAAGAALAIVDELRRHDASWLEDRGAGLEVRVGIHTGLVVTRGLLEVTPATLGPIVGTTPIIAAGLTAQARAGEVVASGDTGRLLRGHMALEPRGQHTIDVLRRPIDVFLVEAEPSAGDLPPPTSRARAMPLIGRDQELELLRQRFRHAAAGSGQIVLVSGEAGIGKSRLCQELGLSVQHEVHAWLECRCAPEGRNSALRPVVEMLERLLDRARGAGAQDPGERLTAFLLGYGFTREEATGVFAPLLGLSPALDLHEVSSDRQRERTLNALLSLLHEMAARGPVLFAVEDLHWADPTTLELLALLVGEAQETRIFALFTARPGFSPPWSGSSLLHLQLGRLEPRYVEEMVVRAARGRELPHDVIQEVAERTDGVPLFIEELTHMVLESGLLSGRHAEIPATLRDSLAARLDRLGRTKETAQIAAALGREFRDDVLCAVSTLGEAAVREDLDRLVRADLVYRRRRMRNPTYVFKHALVRDTAYESLLRRTRIRVHARIAQVLEERFPEIVEARPDLLALHHAAALETRKAIAYAQRAADGAIERSANAETIAYVTQALGWLDGLDDPREHAAAELALNATLTRALMANRGYGATEVLAVLERSLALIADLGDSPHAVPVLWASLVFNHIQSRRQKALGIAERLLSIAAQTHDVGLEVATLPVLGQCLHVEGRLGESQERLERAVALYQPDQHRQHAFVYGLDSNVSARMTLGPVLFLRGYPEQALSQSLYAVETARALGHAATTGFALLNLAILHHLRRERASVERVTAELGALVDGYGLSMLGSLCELLRGWAQSDADRAGKGVEILLATGQEVSLSYWLSLLAEVEADEGSYPGAVAHLDDAAGHAEATGEIYYLAEIHRIKGVSLLRADPRATGAALECFRAALAAARRISAKLPELRAAREIAALSLSCGEIGEGRAALAPVVAWFSEGADSEDLVEARALLDQLGES